MRKRIRRRYEAAVALFPKLGLKPAIALRQALGGGYGKRDLAADLVAGLIVGIVALPLAMALAIAVDVPPQLGLYTAIVGGFVIAFLGGSRVQVSGPTAAFIVILAPIGHKFGIGGLALATLMAGAILIIMGLARMGRLIEFIPHPVTTGFTSGIAVVIATSQLKDFFGLTTGKNPDHYIDRVRMLVAAADTAHAPDITIGVVTLAILIFWPRVTKRIPGPLFALAFAAVLAYALDHLVAGGFHAATIADRFHYTVDGATRAGIPPMPPVPVLPWDLPGTKGVSFDMLYSLLPSAFAIAMLGAIESLLCAVVADGMAGTKHDPDAELVAQGIGNVVVPFFGGIAATGAIARTATNIRAGARSPVAAMTHAIFMLAAVLALAPLLAYLPMASLAALLLIVAWNMSERHHFAHIIRVAPKSDAAVLLACFSLTVVFDMVVSVSIGVVLAALLFMRRMADISSTRLVGEHPVLKEPLPKHVLLYEIAGPLFFGAAQKAVGALGNVRRYSTVILYMGGVPAMDVTGLVALESALANLRQARAFVILAGIQAQPAGVLAKAGIRDVEDELILCQTLDEAVETARTRPPPRRGTDSSVSIQAAR
jgi:sulfate permease, SulP family